MRALPPNYQSSLPCQGMMIQELIYCYFRMRALPPKYQSSLPCQGIRCHIEGLSPPKGAISWTKKSLMSMMNVLANVPIDAKIVVSIGSDHNPVTGANNVSKAQPPFFDYCIYPKYLDRVTPYHILC